MAAAKPELLITQLVDYIATRTCVSCGNGGKVAKKKQPNDCTIRVGHIKLTVVYGNSAYQ